MCVVRCPICPMVLEDVGVALIKSVGWRWSKLKISSRSNEGAINWQLGTNTAVVRGRRHLRGHTPTITHTSAAMWNKLSKVLFVS